MRLVSPDGTVKSNLEYARFNKDAFSQLSPVWNMSQIGLKAFLARLTHSRNVSSLPIQESSCEKYPASKLQFFSVSGGSFRFQVLFRKPRTVTKKFSDAEFCYPPHYFVYLGADFSSLAQFVLWVAGGTEQSLVSLQSICRLVVNQASNL